MKIHRFLFDWPQGAEEVEIEKPDLVNQIRKVLRLQIGERLSLLDGKGREAETEILSFDKETVRLKVLDEKIKEEANRKVRLCCAVLKKENFDLVVQKATESGVKEIVPIISERTVKTGFKKERLQKIATEAAEQSGRAFLPTINSVLSLKEALEKFCSSGVCLSFDPEGKELRESLGEEATLFVGPEGGWSEEEKKLFEDHEAKLVSLGSLTLRGETAAIVGTFLVVNGFGLLSRS